LDGWLRSDHSLSQPAGLKFTFVERQRFRLITSFFERLWDQRAEAGYMKKIEDEFQALVNKLEVGLRDFLPTNTDA
jgi:hypothetical protein